MKCKIFMTSLMLCTLQAEKVVYQFDFGNGKGFDDGIFLGNDLPSYAKIDDLEVGDEVEFESYPDDATVLESSRGSALVFWGTHTGFKGTKKFKLSRNDLAEGRKFEFALQMGNWHPDPIDYPKPTHYDIRNFKAEIFLDGKKVGTLKGRSPKEDTYTAYTYSTTGSRLKAGNYELVFTVEMDGVYGAIDLFTVTAKN